MSRRLRGAPLLLVFVGLALLASIRMHAQNPPAAGEYKPPPPPVQPIAYSHKQHLAQGLDCALCHAKAKTDDHATLPPTATCMTCHTTVKTDSAEIQKLKG